MSKITQNCIIGKIYSVIASKESINPVLSKICRDYSICENIERLAIQYQLNKKSQMEVNVSILENILSIRTLKNLNKLMEDQVRKYSLSQQDLIRTKIKDIVSLAHRLNERKKVHQTQDSTLAEKWMWREQKLFNWIIIYYAEASRTDIGIITQQEFQIIIDLFPSKKPVFLFFEYTLTFCSSSESRAHWSQSEVEALRTILSSKSGEYQWKTISYELYKITRENYFKGPDSCRNRWENHSNPCINKGEWTSTQDRKMLDSIMKLGPRWAAISKTVCLGRTEHMVNNRFPSLLTKYHINYKQQKMRQTCLLLINQINAESIDPLLDRQSTYFDVEHVNKESQSSEIGSSSETIDRNEMVPNIQWVVSKDRNNCFEGKKTEINFTIDQIIQYAHETEYGENYRYMNSLDEQWIANLLQRSQFGEEKQEIDIDCF